MTYKHWNWLLVLVKMLKMRHLYFTVQIWQICNVSQEQQEQQLLNFIDRDARGENATIFRANAPGIYTRVKKYLKWIYQVAGEGRCNEDQDDDEEQI